MNYDQPRQIAEGPHAGKWQYTTANRRTGTHPIGYCWAPPDGAEVEDPSTWTQHYHDTSQEARECYGRFLRDQVRLDVELRSWSGCCAPVEQGRCDRPTKTAAVGHLGWNLVPLCEAHLDRETAIRSGAAPLGPAGDSMHS